MGYSIFYLKAKLLKVDSTIDLINNEEFKHELGHFDKTKEKYESMKMDLIDSIRKLESIDMSLPVFSMFQTRRESLNMTIREVSDKTKISCSTISRIENGCNCSYDNAIQLHSFYTNNGV